MKKYLIPLIIAGVVVLMAISSGVTYFIAKGASKAEIKSDVVNTASTSSDEKVQNENNVQKEGCLIKGNISSSGEKIYHVQGGSSYEKTQIDTSKGERWFCTEQEAQDAGWRKSKT